MEYVFRVGNGTDSFSSQGAFKTAEQDLNRFTFINITDTQGVTARDYAKWKDILDKALIKFPDARFLLHSGDMVDEGHKIAQWDLFAGAVKDEFMKLPIMPAVGNHEAFNKNGTNPDVKNFTNSFNLPLEQDTGAPSGTVYSFDYGNVHIAVMNTQCGSKNLKKQADWLRRDMTGTKKLWKIVALHRGPYGATYDTTDIRTAWTPVFDEAGVDLVFQGHDHNYVRSYPMKNKTKVRAGQGTVYMIGNSGGVKFYPKKTRTWQEVNLQPKTQMYIAVILDEDEMVIEAYDSKNVLRDSLTLKKN
jgi:predicted ester cyclase